MLMSIYLNVHLAFDDCDIDMFMTIPLFKINLPAIALQAIAQLKSLPCWNLRI